MNALRFLLIGLSFGNLLLICMLLASKLPESEHAELKKTIEGYSPEQKIAVDKLVKQTGRDAYISLLITDEVMLVWIIMALYLIK